MWWESCCPTPRLPTAIDMNFTLHLTADCNFACEYCYEKHSPAGMDERTTLAACELLFSYGHKKNGFSFFGGEPLLKRDIIERVTEYCAERSAGFGGEMRYSMTTNGALLDEGFLRLANERGISIALSHDGPLQDEQRRDRGGSGTAERLEPVIDLLLSYQPDSTAMLTIARKNAGRLAEAAIWLHGRGFSKLNFAIDMRPETPWDDDDMRVLEEQYRLLAEYCAHCYDSARPLHCLNLESKIAAYLNDRPCMECRLGFKQPSVAPDGRIYPCNQFLNLPEYEMGSVFEGIDRAAQRRYYAASLKKEDSCTGCAIEKRCRHHCPCLNFSMTGDMHEVPPVQCASEQALIRAADSMAELLYKRKSPRFMRAYDTHR